MLRALATVTLLIRLEEWIGSHVHPQIAVAERGWLSCLGGTETNRLLVPQPTKWSVSRTLPFAYRGSDVSDGLDKWEVPTAFPDQRHATRDCRGRRGRGFLWLHPALGNQNLARPRLYLAAARKCGRRGHRGHVARRVVTHRTAAAALGIRPRLLAVESSARTAAAPPPRPSPSVQVDELVHVPHGGPAIARGLAGDRSAHRCHDILCRALDGRSRAPETQLVAGRLRASRPGFVRCLRSTSRLVVSRKTSKGQALKEFSGQCRKIPEQSGKSGKKILRKSHLQCASPTFSEFQRLRTLFCERSLFRGRLFVG